MGVYRMTIEGRNKPLLLRAKSLMEARNLLVDGASLTAEQVEEALVDGEKVWVPGTPLPDDSAARDADADGDELEYLRFFHGEADFGPADGDVRQIINDAYLAKTGKNVPAEYVDEEEEA